MRVPLCESCGAPLEARWAEIVIVCAYCGAQNAPGRAGEPVPPSVPDDGRPRLAVAGRTYVLVGHLASGETTEVYEGRWVMRLGERVVVKVLRDPADEDLLRREHATLARLHGAGGPLVQRLPRPVAMGPVRLGDDERLVLVHRWRPGFVRTAADVKQAHPDGVAPQSAVWLLKRLLESLGGLHRAGFVHGGVIPPHVLVHGRDHGAVLVGFATVTARGEPLPAASRAWREWYRRAPGEPVEPADDVAMAARLVRELSAPIPGALGALFAEAADGDHTDAWALRDRVDVAAHEAFGPPAYHPIP